jgi:hypothetical protein
VAVSRLALQEVTIPQPMMRAAVLEEPGASMRVGIVPRPVPRAGEVLLRVRAFAEHFNPAAQGLRFISIGSDATLLAMAGEHAVESVTSSRAPWLQEVPNGHRARHP